MVFRKADRILQRIPGVNNIYRDNYIRIKQSFYALNRRLPLVNTPIYVHWHSTYDCNFHCKHCGADAGNKRIELLSTEHILRAVEDMGDLGVKTLIITGGEPLLRSDIFEVFRAARDAGIKNLSLATNGFIVEEFKRELLSANLSAVHMSIDGPPEINDVVRGQKGASKKAWQALDFFKEIGVRDRILNTLVHQKNIHELEKFSEDVFNSSATLWNLQIPLLKGRAKRHEFVSLKDEEIVCLFNFILKKQKRFPIKLAPHSGYLGPLDHLLRPTPFFCGAGCETCAILPDGEVVGCQVLYDPSYSEGNIKVTPFKEIWRQKYGRFKMPEQGEECRTCEYWGPCRGGCVALRKTEGRCLKNIWENEKKFFIE